MESTITKYKDGQVTASVEEGESLTHVISGSSYEDLFRMASIKEAWDSNPDSKTLPSTLIIGCLIGQRSDRRFSPNTSFDLKIIANFINSMNYDEVRILHPHSDVSLALINNSVRISHAAFVDKAIVEAKADLLISPDAGAYKTTYEIAERLGIRMIASNKVRVDGEPLIQVQGDVKDKDCLIVDDMADGGRTFINLAKELRKQGATKVYLYVTHGMFHYGFDELKEHIDHIYCTNSYKEIKDEYVTQFKV